MRSVGLIFGGAGGAGGRPPQVMALGETPDWLCLPVMRLLEAAFLLVGNGRDQVWMVVCDGRDWFGDSAQRYALLFGDGGRL